MQSSPVKQPSNNQTRFLSQEDRGRIYQLLNDLTTDQLRLFLTKHLRSSTLLNEIQHYTRAQLFQECFALIDNYYTPELEQALFALRQQRFASDYYAQQSPTILRKLFNTEKPAFHPHQGMQYDGQPKLNFSTSPTVQQQLIINRSNLNPTPLMNNHDFCSSNQHNSYSNSIFPGSQILRNPPPGTTPRPTSSSTTGIQQSYQIPILPIPSYIPTPTSLSSLSSRPTPILPTPVNNQNSTLNRVVFKNLPFYHTMACIFERNYVFHFDSYRKHFASNDEFILPLEVCNQLSLSYDYDSEINSYKTNKHLLLRLARIDQSPGPNGKHEDSLPPNLLVIVNGQSLTNLPTPKPSTRQQTDLLRPGREIDITPHIMFNPMLKNEVKITWCYRQDNIPLHMQYVNAKYAMHIYLAEHLTVEKLCEKVLKKPKFNQDDLIKLLHKACAKDRDLGLEVSDQKLKIICPIDQRRLRRPARATTCQHIQCFDLINYITLNEKSNKWMCPVCNKSALFEDLQIDYFTETVLNTIKNEKITEISIDANLRWQSVLPINGDDTSKHSRTVLPSFLSSSDVICIEDD